MKMMREIIKEEDCEQLKKKNRMLCEGSKFQKALFIELLRSFFSVSSGDHHGSRRSKGLIPWPPRGDLRSTRYFHLPSFSHFWKCTERNWHPLELLTILGDFVSSLLFLLMLTFIGNYLESSGTRTGWGAVALAEIVTLVAAATVHRVCITTRFLFSAGLLYEVHKLSGIVPAQNKPKGKRY